MTLTLHDITPIGLCIATQELFDAKRFRANFGDNLLLKSNDQKIKSKLMNLKRELNSTMTEKKFLDGHKTAIISNIDKILSLVASRYTQIDLKAVELIFDNGKELIDKVFFSTSFDEISRLEPVFRSKITLPVYELFLDQMKRSDVRMI
jgi:hypothetical protein